MDTLQDRLAAARHAAGLTQEKLAQRLSVTTTTVARWELSSGQYRPTLAHLEALASLYGVTLGALLDDPVQNLSGLGPLIGPFIRCPATAPEVLSIEDQVAEEFASHQPEH